MMKFKELVLSEIAIYLTIGIIIGFGYMVGVTLERLFVDSMRSKAYKTYSQECR